MRDEFDLSASDNLIAPSSPMLLPVLMRMKWSVSLIQKRLSEVRDVWNKSASDSWIASINALLYVEWSYRWDREIPNFGERMSVIDRPIRYRVWVWSRETWSYFWQRCRIVWLPENSEWFNEWLSWNKKSLRRQWFRYPILLQRKKGHKPQTCYSIT
jgi:hypothetical protein